MRQIEARRDHLIFGMFVKSTKGLEPSDLSQDLQAVRMVGNEKAAKNTVISDGQKKKTDKKDKKRREKHKGDESSDDEKVAKKKEKKKIKSEKNKNQTKKSRRHLTDDDMLREIGQPRKKLGKLARAAEQEAAFLRSLQAESH
jgi:hypothetical protein